MDELGRLRERVADAPTARDLAHAQEIIEALYAEGAAMAETIDALRAEVKRLSWVCPDCGAHASNHKPCGERK